MVIEILRLRRVIAALLQRASPICSTAASSKAISTASSHCMEPSTRYLLTNVFASPATTHTGDASSTPASDGQR